MTIFDKIKFHQSNKKFARITREVAEGCTEISRGYIVGHSKDFIILQETDDFSFYGYSVLPVSQIIEIRFNSYDRYYDKIMKWEKEIDKVSLAHKIDLTSWQTIFKSIKKTGLGVIVECEDPDIDTFTIGPVVRTSKKLVYILYFGATGISDDKPTSIDYASITNVRFDDRYINVFSKYVRHKKKKI
jgi:hypothetical protein